MIRDLDADVVGVLESYERLPEIARKTGYPYYNTSLQLLSKYPILEPLGRGRPLRADRGRARLRDPVLQRPPRLRRVGSAGAAQGRTRSPSVIESENEVRTSAMEQPLEAMAGLLDDGLSDLPHRRLQPAVEPRLHRGDGRHPRGDPRAGAVAGERGAVRARVPRHLPRGASRPGRGARDHPPQRRADRLRLRGGPVDDARQRSWSASPAARTSRSRSTPWTSDHRAVLSTLRGDAGGDADPGRGRRAPAHGRRRDHDHLQRPGSDGNEIAIVPEGGDPDPIETLDAAGERGTTSSTPPAGTPGSYEVVLADGDGAEIARVLVLPARSGGGARALDRPASLRARRADRGRVVAGAREPLGLARGLRGLGLGPRRRTTT